MYSSEVLDNKILEQPKHRFQVLDIFRGIFAFFVFLFHLNAFAKTQIINNDLFRNGDLFVDFFFVLSGFVISYNYKKITGWNGALTFLKKRFLRIYPLHFLMLLIFVIVELLKGVLASHITVNQLDNPANNIYTFFLSLTLLNSTPLFSSKDVSWNIVSWSISAEMIAYLVFMFSLLSLGRLRRLKSAELVVPVGVLLASCLTLIWITGSYQILYTFDYGFLRGIIGFFVGVVCLKIFELSQSSVSKLNNQLFNLAEIFIVLLIIITISHGDLLKSYGLAFELIFFACIYIFSFEKGILSTLLKRSVFLKKMGQYSYSIYMIHPLMISLFNVFFIRILKFSDTSYSYLFILNFALIYVCSAWTYKNIEMRFYAAFTKKKAL